MHTYVKENMKGGRHVGEVWEEVGEGKWKLNMIIMWYIYVYIYHFTYVYMYVCIHLVDILKE